VKIQITGGKVCLRCKGKTLLGGVIKLLKAKSLLISLNNVLPYYSSVPNRHVGQSKRAGGKILKKTLNVQTKIRPCRGDFFLKINKHAGQIPS
jgi:hypothetical protein